MLLTAFNRLLIVLACTFPFSVGHAQADKQYGPGVSDTEIRIGQTMPYSGPASALGTHGRVIAAYFRQVNEMGGINGRRIALISLDDGFAPPKTVEATRRLVEQDEVLLMFGSLGTATNLAVQKYLNTRRVPQLFLISGMSKMADPQRFPWTMGFVPDYQLEGGIYARYLLAQRPHAKVAVLYQNDDFGRDLRTGFLEVLGSRAGAMIAAEATYELSDPTIDQQIITLKASGADTLVTFATPKAGAQTLRKLSDMGWKPLHLVSVASSSYKATLEPAGPEKALGLLSARALKDPLEADWKGDKGMQDYLAFMLRYYPEGEAADPFNTMAYSAAQAMVHVLQRCGNNLTRENVLQVATQLNRLELPLLLPGMSLSTSPSNYRPFSQLQLARFDGKRWVRFGELVNARD